MNNADSSAQSAYVLGGYEIVETTGAGGMGVVYKGIDPALGRAVAIKVLKDELQAHPAVVARFRREAEAIATLNHPNIVRIYAVGDSDTVPYIAMEFVEGRTLSDLLVDSGSLPGEEALDIALQAADALVCAHDCQIVHRDIKPANILITDDGTVKVTDFGIAKVLNAATQLTVDGARIGTPQYMCPERCKNMPTTPSSDIYALGVMLFQCVTGRLPYEAASAAELISKIAYEVPKRVRTYKPDVPETVDRLVAYMLEKEAENRPPDCRNLRDLIDRVRRGDGAAEALPAMDAALAAVRAETPVPQILPDTTTTQSTGWLTQVQHRWYGLSRGIRISMALGFLAMLLGGATTIVVSALTQRIDVTERFQAHGDISRWTQRGTLATFLEETPSIILGTIMMDDFYIRKLQWIGGADGAVALLQGEANSLRDGQTALLTINPYLQQVNVSLPPVPRTGEGSPSLTLLGTGQQSADMPGMLLGKGDGTWFLSARPGVAPQPVAPWATHAAVLADTAGTVVLARNNHDGQNQLLMLPADGAVAAQTALPIQGTVHKLAAHVATGRLAVLYQSDTALRLDVLSVKYPNEPGEMVREGALGLGLRPFSPSGGKLAFLEGIENGLGRAIVQSLYNRHDHTVIGTAYDVIWRPGTEELLLLAPDYAGRRQLWVAKSTQSDQRLQITHLDSGVGTNLVVSDDGRYAIVDLPHKNSFVIVELSSTE
ncbi:MAG: serine/threonine protein kinase [Candidatus Hydrogenedentes bacterium]|nr:serine/threonine protein kinase [Candidatus Hydrogenedentota bacterium]